MSASVLPTVDPADVGGDNPFRWLWLAEAVDAQYGGYSPLRRYIAEGRLTSAEKVGTRWRVRKYDLDGLIVRRAVEPSCDDVEAAVARIVASAPPLTDAQIRRLGATFVDQLARRQVVDA